MRQPNLAFEAKIIKRFVIEPKQERFLAFLKNDRTRRKFTEVLSQVNVFKEELFERIDGDEREVIRARIEGLNVQSCYVISENEEIDQHRFDIETALKTVISPWSDTGTVIVFGGGEVVYLECEGMKNKWISRV
ncbi:MAG TPA: hypothetical protein VEC36_10295 [Patescibacteria group bacterium]|nr:hypothetical protein [Patescibacteria group bacterium]